MTPTIDLTNHALIRTREFACLESRLVNVVWLEKPVMGALVCVWAT